MTRLRGGCVVSARVVGLAFAMQSSAVPAFAQALSSPAGDIGREVATSPIVVPSSTPAATRATPVAQPPSVPVSAAAMPAAAETVGTTTVPAAPPADYHVIHELSPWSMFLAADVVVKAVMISLMIASLVTWTVLVGKSIELLVARRWLARELTRSNDATMIAEARLALGRGGFMAHLLAAASSELELAHAGSPRAGIMERTESRFSDLVRTQTQDLRRGMGLLATIGSTAPFVGLFGTVWGIMNSFIGISKSQTTNLAVVAPGIAEALLATAAGLVAAIPAVIIYNHFSRAIRRHQHLVILAVGAVTRLLSRELDQELGGSSDRSARAAE